MRTAVRILVGLIAGLLSLVGLGWLGFQVKARSFEDLSTTDNRPHRPIPDGLPAPLLRHAALLFPNGLPEVKSAVVQGRARLAPTGVYLPTRFRFSYDAEQIAHYHHIQVTWFSLPFLQIHEMLRDGTTRLDLSFLGTAEDQPRINRAALQGYWAEVLAWVPAIVLSDERIRWEGVDEHTARLIIPELDEEEAFTVRFDPETGLLHEIEALRYQEADNPQRQQWRNRVLEWGEIEGQKLPMLSETQWNDDPPWAAWQLEQVAINVDVAERFERFGESLNESSMPIDAR
ncbi:MAG: hypothetical protein GYB68_08115 [Chloroflexi bacterium]|nr:hypothetical protein [Chloroflexota bacterium]